MKLSASLTALVALSACTSTGTSTYDPYRDYESVQPATMMSAPESRLAGESDDIARRGRYLVELVGCGTCHTDGALIGQPRTDRWLAGSRVGIAYTNPTQFDNPGVLFPPNLTTDKDTGLGRWSDEEIANKIRTGVNRHGGASAPVMPWPAFARLSDADVDAIVAYLTILPAVSHKVPATVPPGTKSKEQFVHFGVYRSRR